MARDFERRLRVAQVLHRALSKQIQSSVNDERCHRANIVEVDVSPDLKGAKVYISVLDEDQKNIDEVVASLNGAAGFLRTQIAKTQHFRRVPSLKFIYDGSMVHGNKISALLNKTKENK